MVDKFMTQGNFQAETSQPEGSGLNMNYPYFTGKKIQPRDIK